MIGSGRCEVTPAIQTAFEKWKTGEYAYWDNRAYTSCAVVPEKVWSKGFQVFIRQRGMQPGGYVDPISSNRGEREYLLGRDARYRVSAWGESKSGTRKFLLLDEVEDVASIPEKQAAPPRMEYEDVMVLWRNELAAKDKP